MNPPIGATDPASVASEVYQYHRLHPELVEQLISIYRVMFPHDSIPDEFYEHVVQKLDEKAEQDQNLPCSLSEGVEALNALTGCAWFETPGGGTTSGTQASRTDSLLSNAAVGLRQFLLQQSGYLASLRIPGSFQ